MYQFMDSEGDHSPPSKSKPLGCPKQGKDEEQGEEREGEKRREKRGGRKEEGEEEEEEEEKEESVPKRARRMQSLFIGTICTVYCNHISLVPVWK